MNQMLQRCLKSLFLLLFLFLFFACSTSIGLNQPQAEDIELNQQVAKMMAVYSKALTSNDPAIVEEFQKVLAEFDAVYQTSLVEEFNQSFTKKRFDDSTTYDPLTDLPLNKDGAVYLSGGGGSLVSSVIDFVSPKSNSSSYYHGAIFDQNKFDPTNLDSQCFQTAVTKGAGYETPNEWMRKPNVAVLNPKTALNQTSLNSAQSSLDYYCSPSNTNMQYGFFKDYFDIFSIVTKEDNFYWYCTKVVWRVYKQLGIDIDSNGLSLSEWKASGLYSLVHSYYYVKYFYNTSLASKKENEYIKNAIKILVHAQEIYISPYLSKIYERIRSY